MWHTLYYIDVRQYTPTHNTVLGEDVSLYNRCVSDQQIMSELLLHESGLSSMPSAGPSSSSSGPPLHGDLQATKYSSSSEGEGEGEDMEEGGGWMGAQSVPNQSDEDSSDEEFTIKVYT